MAGLVPAIHVFDSTRNLILLALQMRHVMLAKSLLHDAAG
jgi:hypothetical protein